MTKLISTISLLFAITFISGCTGNMFNVAEPPSVGAAGLRTFPAIVNEGQTIVLRPGDYSCPKLILPGTHIIGQGSIIPAEMLLNNQWSSKKEPFALPETRIHCPGGITVNHNGVEISGVVWDFEGVGGFVLEDVFGGKLDMGIVNSDVGLFMHATRAGTGVVDVTIPRLEIYNTNVGVIMRGDGGGGVTWNDFGHVSIVEASKAGFIFSQIADTNTIDAMRIRLRPTAEAGLIFNDAGVLGDVDASGNRIGFVGCDAGFEDAATWNGYCVDFRGYTVGNKMTVSFGIMHNANKVHYANQFDQDSNIVQIVQEIPKFPGDPQKGF